jgi:hypothetical protein
MTGKPPKPLDSAANVTGSPVIGSTDLFDFLTLSIITGQ